MLRGAVREVDMGGVDVGAGERSEAPSGHPEGPSAPKAPRGPLYHNTFVSPLANLRNLGHTAGER